MFLTCFRTLCAKPAGRNISIYRHENYEGRDENISKKKKEGNRTKQNFPLTLRTECWHLKPSVTWSSPTSSASCPSTLASHGWHSTKSQMRHCCFPPRAGAALLLLPTLPGVAQGPPPPGKVSDSGDRPTWVPILLYDLPEVKFWVSVGASQSFPLL